MNECKPLDEGREESCGESCEEGGREEAGAPAPQHPGARGFLRASDEQGRVVQVDPIRPMLKSPVTKRFETKLR